MTAPTSVAPSPMARPDEVLVVVDAGWDAAGESPDRPDLANAPRSIGGRHVTAVRADALSERVRGAPHLPEDDVARGAVPGPRSVLGPALREADRGGAAAVALVAADPRGEAPASLERLLSPVLDLGYEFVCPSYARSRFDGMLGTAIVYPLTRALYGLRLRQPSGGEAVLSLQLARDLVADPDWQRDPLSVGSDAWLAAKVLSQRRRICQVWLGSWPWRAADEDASRAIVRMVGPVLRELERHADVWQRIDGSAPVRSFGELDGSGDDPAGVDVAPLASAFRLGLRELGALWGLVLPPATLFALQRAGGVADDSLRVDDLLWARIVYDFAVAYSIRAVERSQLLASLTPLYLGWVAGFVNDVQRLDHAATEDRVEALCGAFEREKRYLIRRWRWPDSFNP